MAFTRQPIDRRLFELAGFSLPAVAACVVLLLIPPGHNANQVTPVVMNLPYESTVSTVQTQAAGIIAPTALPVVPPAETPTETTIEIEAPQPMAPLTMVVPNEEPATTLSRQAPAIAPSQPHAIIVQAGHTLWRIARETYGYGRDYPVIVDANRNTIAKPELIHPGQQLVLPDKKAD